MSKKYITNIATGIKNSIISYFISKYTGTDNQKTVEDTPEKIISDMEKNFMGWLNYMSN